MRRFILAFSLLLILFMVILPSIAPLDPLKTNPDIALSQPSKQHLLGTDLLGRDVLSRVLHGGRHTIQVALLATLFSASIGGVLGVLAGVASKYIDLVLSSVTDALLAIPPLVIALVVITVIGRGEWQISIAIGLSQIANFAKVTRGVTKSIYSQTYIESAIASGATPTQIIYRHILPNISPIVMSYIGVVFSYCILNGSALSFLGLGAELGTPDWGMLMNEGRAILHIVPSVTLVSGLCIAFVVAIVNTITNRITEF